MLKYQDYRIILIFALLSYNFYAEADIYPISDIKIINDTIIEVLDKRDPENVLIILPLQNFIVKATDHEFQIYSTKHQPILKETLKKAKLSTIDYLPELILTEYETSLADPFLPTLIQNIQNKKAPLIITTPNIAGSFNKIPYLEIWTYNYLREKGIDIGIGRFSEIQFSFDQGFGKNKSNYPTFYRGLLSGNLVGSNNSISQILSVLIFGRMKQAPDTIIAVHSDVRYLETLETQLKLINKDIEFIGLNYILPITENRDLDIKAYTQFWEKLIYKLNQVTRTNIDNTLEDPYEQ